MKKSELYEMCVKAIDAWKISDDGMYSNQPYVVVDEHRVPVTHVLHTLAALGLGLTVGDIRGQFKRLSR